jgi:hypothetical protein
LPPRPVPRPLCYSPNLPDDGRGRESSRGWRSPATAAEGEKSAEARAESLRQKDRGPEGVLESSIGFARSAPTG